ncbi:MAG: DUF4304 domain-containing protein [Thermoanaerobaculia bacterium]|nr:DUF4304 domain-containing protein [Thermoanaerobaculia bacterium]
MDSKAVNKEIRRTIWPALKTHGFTQVSARTAWRHGDQKIDVVNFQSFNSYNADVMGVTTFSFAVNLGAYLRYVPPQWPPTKIKDGVPYPAEYECQFRGGLNRAISQPKNAHAHVWLVETDGRNLGWCVNDVLQKIPEALAWFERLESKNSVLRILLEQPEQMSSLWGFGNRPSPHRSYLLGYVAMQLGNDALADLEFSNAVASGCYAHLFSSVSGARHRAV